MRGTVLRINRSPGGIPKTPIEEAIVSPAGVRGDSWAHPKFHGGPKQALLLITTEAIEELTEQGFPIFPGALGENLTVGGMDRRGWRSGQRYRAGDVILQLTKLRVPCRTLDIYGPGIQSLMYDSRCKQGDPETPLWARGGFYASVEQGGIIRPGDIISLED